MRLRVCCLIVICVVMLGAEFPCSLLCEVKTKSAPMCLMENVTIFHAPKNEKLYSSRFHSVQIVLSRIFRERSAGITSYGISGSVLSVRGEQRYALVIRVLEFGSEIRNFIRRDYSGNYNRHLELFGERFTRIFSGYTNNKRLVQFRYTGNASSSNPSSLIQPHSILGGTYGLFGLSFGGSTIIVRQFLLPNIASLCFSEGIAGDLYGITGSIGGSFRRMGLFTSVIGIETSDKDQSDSTSNLYVFPYITFIFFGLLNIAALGLIVAAFAIVGYFDRWRQGWGWGLLRCIGICTCIYLAFHLIWHGLALIGE